MDDAASKWVLENAIQEYAVKVWALERETANHLEHTMTDSGYESLMHANMQSVRLIQCLSRAFLENHRKKSVSLTGLVNYGWEFSTWRLTPPHPRSLFRFTGGLLNIHRTLCRVSKFLRQQ